MINKIIGFLITKAPSSVPFVDFLSSESVIEKISFGPFDMYIWGYGNLNECKIDNQYSLSFPLSNSLLDRNILISFEDNRIIIENDWLGSIPVFYNIENKTISTNCNFCITERSVDIDGAALFCEFGYSVFETTPFKNVKFLRYYSSLQIDKDKVQISYKEDSAVQHLLLEKPSTVSDVINLISNKINTLTNRFYDYKYIIPTSGGYDSRIINFLIKNKKNIESYSYSTRGNSSNNYEIFYAKKLSELFNISWHEIKLGNFNSLIPLWFKIYGFSTHLHGMYQMDFYLQIKKSINKNCFLISGIVGDAWAGSIINKKNILSVEDVKFLSYNHGVEANPLFTKIKSKEFHKNSFLKINKKYLCDPRSQTVFIIRMKMILLSYLMQIPEYIGLPSWSPFLNFEIASAMLNLPEKERKQRKWQLEFFRKNSINFEEQYQYVSKIVNLDYAIALKTSFTPLNIKKLEFIYDEKRLHQINKILSGSTKNRSKLYHLFYIPKVGGLLRLLGFKDKLSAALKEYYVLKAIEMGIP